MAISGATIRLATGGLALGAAAVVAGLVSKSDTQKTALLGGGALATLAGAGVLALSGRGKSLAVGAAALGATTVLASCSAFSGPEPTKYTRYPGDTESVSQVGPPGWTKGVSGKPVGVIGGLVRVPAQEWNSQSTLIAQENGRSSEWGVGSNGNDVDFDLRWTKGSSVTNGSISSSGSAWGYRETPQKFSLGRDISRLVGTPGGFQNLEEALLATAEWHSPNAPRRRGPDGQNVDGTMAFRKDEAGNIHAFELELEKGKLGSVDDILIGDPNIVALVADDTLYRPTEEMTAADGSRANRFTFHSRASTYAQNSGTTLSHPYTKDLPDLSGIKYSHAGTSVRALFETPITKIENGQRVPYRFNSVRDAASAVATVRSEQGSSWLDHLLTNFRREWDDGEQYTDPSIAIVRSGNDYILAAMNKDPQSSWSSGPVSTLTGTKDAYVAGIVDIDDDGLSRTYSLHTFPDGEITHTPIVEEPN